MGPHYRNSGERRKLAGNLIMDRRRKTHTEYKLLLVCQKSFGTEVESSCCDPGDFGL